MKLKLLSFALLGLLISSCGGSSNPAADEINSSKSETEAKEVTVEKIDPMQDKGVGTVTSVELGEIDNELATKGEELFEANCTACHKMGKRYVGPDLVDITNRRTSEWIMNMILDPELMVKENQLAKELLMEYSAPMANQSLTEDESRAILEYFRVNDSK